MPYDPGQVTVIFVFLSYYIPFKVRYEELKLYTHCKCTSVDQLSTEKPGL